MRKSRQFVKDGTEQLKPRCGSSLLFKVIHSILDMLPKLVKQYNNTKHSSTKMTPTEASKKKNEGVVYFNLYGDMETLKQKPKFKVGDKVRISKYKRNVFDKGYTPNWSEEIFTVDEIQHTNPITYKLKDLRDEDIQGSFYEPELLKAEATGIQN